MEASFQSRWYSSWSSVHPELLLLKVRPARHAGLDDGDWESGIDRACSLAWLTAGEHADKQVACWEGSGDNAS